MIWTIALLIFIVSGLLIVTPNGNTISSYISFAASIASLILAVVAIFYSIISNQSFFQSIGVLNTIAENIKSNSETINCSISEFHEKSDNLIHRISDVPQSVEKLADGINSRLESIAIPDSNTPKKESNNSTKESFEKPSVGVTISLYMIAQSIEHNKPFRTSDIFEDNGVEGYVNGVLGAIRSLKIHGLSLAYSKGEYTVNDPGDFNADNTISYARSSKNAFSKKLRNQVDDFFSSEDKREENDSEAESD